MSQLPACDRITEIAEILALGLSRMQARKASGKSAPAGDSSLDILAVQSGHPAISKRRAADD